MEQEAIYITGSTQETGGNQHNREHTRNTREAIYITGSRHETGGNQHNREHTWNSRQST